MERKPHFFFLNTILDNATANRGRLNDSGRWRVYERQEILPLIREEMNVLQGDPRRGRDAVHEGWAARWKRCCSLATWCIFATQRTGAVHLNGYITGPPKTSIASNSRHIRVTWENLLGARGRECLHFPLITSSWLGVLFCSFETERKPWHRGLWRITGATERNTVWSWKVGN